MKYTIVGDPHLTLKNLESMEKLIKHVESLGRTTIWLGDMLDTKEIIRGKCLNFWIEYFKKSTLSHIVLVGNHDYFNLECEDHSLRALKTSGTVIVDKPTVIDGMMFLPYIHSPDAIRKIISSVPASVLIGHLDIKGFDMGNNFKSDVGLSPKDLEKFKLVISGHYHKHQTFKNIVYVGSPMTLSFGEANQIKSLGNFDSETLDLSFIQTSLPKHTQPQ